MDAETITFASDRLTLVISPKSSLCCSEVKPATILRRGLLELGIPFSNTRRTRLGVQACGRRHEEAPVLGCETEQKTRCHSPSDQKSVQSPQHQHFGRVPVLGRRAWASRPPPCKPSDRVLWMPSASRAAWCVTSSIEIGLLHNADPAVQAGIECIKQWIVIWHSSGEYQRTRVRGAWRLGLEQPRDGSSRWMKVLGSMRAVICVLLDVGSCFTRLTGSRLALLECTGLSRVRVDSAEWVEILSRDILSVHWAQAATHCDGAGLEKGCDVSTVKQQFCCFSKKRENHAMYGALLV